MFNRDFLNEYMKELLHNTFLIGVLSKLSDLIYVHVGQRLAHRNLSLSVSYLYIFFQLFRSPGGTGRVGFLLGLQIRKEHWRIRFQVLSVQDPRPEVTAPPSVGVSTLQRPLEGALEMSDSVHEGESDAVGGTPGSTVEDEGSRTDEKEPAVPRHALRRNASPREGLHNWFVGRV